MIQNIEISRLKPHPKNPRKDLGDLSELVESIKANGVLQNLTVVISKRDGRLPSRYAFDCTTCTYFVAQACAKTLIRKPPCPEWEYEGDYTVIIGHRRLAASKKAGLTELPCVVVDMSPEDQIATMMTENLQRADLTIYEQAQGIQMMMDLGVTPDDISDKTGLSKTTISRRVKLLELDPEGFRKATKKGATLMDFMQLDKIKDVEKRNKVLATVGTANFKNELQNALDEEKLKERMLAWIDALEKFAIRIEKQGYAGDDVVPMNWLRNYGGWTSIKGGNISIPDDINIAKYYYRVSERQIDVYRDRVEEPETDEDKAKREAREASERRFEQLKAIAGRHSQLRRDFIKGVSTPKARDKEAFASVVAACVRQLFDSYNGYTSITVNRCGTTVEFAELLGELLGIPGVKAESSYVVKADVQAFTFRLETSPERTMLATAYAAMEASSTYPFSHSWDCDLCRYRTEFRGNDNLAALYAFLCSLGYEMSDEEKALLDGTHELYQEVDDSAR